MSQGTPSYPPDTGQGDKPGRPEPTLLLHFDPELFTNLPPTILNRQYFCSNPSKSCIYHISSTKPPSQHHHHSRSPRPRPPTDHFLPLPQHHPHARHPAQHALRFPASRLSSNETKSDFATSQGRIHVPATAKATESSSYLPPTTNYDHTKGNAGAGYSFRGVGRAEGVQRELAEAAKCQGDRTKYQ
ncbi:hypothetical protein BDZ91DRAFT_243293 [Kalaharituber pfeilii]|nr:hypothetical protein BDZ91DRAFT_243293 [Kalaharituber pfeilii]